MAKQYYIKASFKYPSNDIAEPGGPGGILRFAADPGGTVKRIQDLGCTGVIVGFDDVQTSLCVEDGSFIECVQAAGLDLTISVWLYPRSFNEIYAFWSPSWYDTRCSDIWNFIDKTIGAYCSANGMIDCEFYAPNHPYRKDSAGNTVKDLPWTPFVVESFCKLLPPGRFHQVMPIGKQHADAIGYSFECMGKVCVSWDERFDAAGGAFKDPALTIPANPPANAYPAWWDATKQKVQMRWCNKNGTHVPAGNLYRKLWKPTDFADGVVYVDDRDQASVLA